MSIQVSVHVCLFAWEIDKWTTTCLVTCGCGEGIVCLTSPGVQLAYFSARPATCILLAGKGRGGMFYLFCLFTFIPVSLSSLSLAFTSSTISSNSFLSFSGRRNKMTHMGWRVVKPQHNKSIFGVLRNEDSDQRSKKLWTGRRLNDGTNLILYRWRQFA